MGWNRLSVKVMLAVGVASLLTIGIFAWISITTLQRQHIDEVIRSATRFSDTVKRSTHHAMLLNRWEDAFYIMETIAKQEGVARVRIFNKEGLILFSTEPIEVGKIVDKRAESCYACHEAEKPLERLHVSQRARIIETPNSERILGMITPIENAPGCSDNACHAHSPQRPILGVLDIGLSLARADADVAQMAKRMALFAAAMLALILTMLFTLLQRGVIAPVRKLLRGTRRVAEGDLEHVISVRNTDEIGALAVSFNKMTASLSTTRSELAAVVGTLEEKVQERTKALRDAQAQLIQSEKLASLGRLAASIAHEINNPLSGILTYVKLIARKMKDRDDRSAAEDDLKALSLVERETHRCIAIVGNLLDFARQRKPSFDMVDLNDVIVEALSLVENRMALGSIAKEEELGELPFVSADFNQLRQAFVNIFLNACQAMENGGNGGGTLGVASRFVPERDVVEAKVSDTGVGIPPETLSSIFEPFFTTREDGTGLGLSVVYGIIEVHRGTIDIQSEVGKGTSVIIRLPVVRQSEQTNP